jgi:hypothetical protein
MNRFSFQKKYKEKLLFFLLKFFMKKGGQVCIVNTYKELFLWKLSWLGRGGSVPE